MTVCAPAAVGENAGHHRGGQHRPWRRGRADHQVDDTQRLGKVVEVNRGRAVQLGQALGPVRAAVRDQQRRRARTGQRGERQPAH
jgi:hypothetical protein